MSKIESIKALIVQRENELNRGIVSVPTEEYLEMFTKANQGSNDFLLMQMAKLYGYKLAIEDFKEIIENED